ncbi:MAG: FCD domain-containing protein [Verrucomicrobia bacterium]|nr:FCD domain-containing protein [Verrucomicrobiota bacterium]MBV8482970.1 FCD domain-containing protein [Verrucomicrobiota bacterium]
MKYTLIDFLGNAIISSAYRVNLLKLRIFRREQTRLDEAHVIPTMREHLAVLEGLATREPRRAADAIAAHILRARDRALGLHDAATVDRTSTRTSRPKK